MASYKFVLAAVIALAISSCNCRADMIDDVCNVPQWDEKNYSLCIVTLRLDPRATPPLTYKLLAVIAIDGAIKQSRWGADVAWKVKNEKNKEAVESCSNALVIAHSKMGEAKYPLKKLKDANSRKLIDILLSQAWMESYMCSKNFPNLPPELKRYNGNVRSLANLIRRLIYMIPLV